jgi:hypothetical protein
LLSTSTPYVCVGVSREQPTIDLTRERPGAMTEVFDGFWVLSTMQLTNGSKWFPATNSRTLVFRLQDKGTPVLVVVLAVEPAAIPEVRALADSTGLPVTYVISPSGRRHLFMRQWHDAFPGAQILLCPTRTPRTANGKALMELERVSTMNPDDPLPQFEGQLDAVLFRGLSTLPDSLSPIEGGPDSLWTTMKAAFRTKTGRNNDPVDDLWLRHAASSTVIGGENLGWMYPADVLRQQPIMLRAVVKPDAVYIVTDARPVADPTVVAGCWDRILSWPARTLISYHDAPGYSRQNGCQEELRQAVVNVNQN